MIQGCRPFPLSGFSRMASRVPVGSLVDGRSRIKSVAGLAGIFVLLSACSHRAPAAAVPAGTGSAVTANTPSCAVPVSNVASLAGTPISDPLVTFDSAWAIIARTHWDTTYNGVNWKALRETLRPRAAAAKTTGELRAVMTEMLGTLKQSHFSIIPREVSDATSAGSNSPRGADQNGTTGATFRLIDGGMVVTHAPAKSAAARAGVQPGWQLEAINGCPLSSRLRLIPKDMDVRRASLTAYSLTSAMLAGPVGDAVAATFRDGAGRLQNVSIVREAESGTVAKFGNLPPLNSSLKFERVERDGKTIGVISFNIWMPVLLPQFAAAIDSLRDTDGIVLDLRGNFGGVGGMAMGVAGHFLDTARTIGTMVQRGAALKFVANPQFVDTRNQRVRPFAGPMAIVVDELSISTSEIFAGGMQALGRSRVFGSQTSGQALPSVPERLPNGDILYHAIADFLSPTGKTLEGDGVRPDVLAPVTKKALREGKDPARDAALSWAAQAAKLPPKKGATP